MQVVYSVTDWQGRTHVFRDEAKAKALAELVGPTPPWEWQGGAPQVQWCDCGPDGLCDAGKVWGT